MDKELVNVFTKTLTNSGIIGFITKFESYDEGKNEYFFTARFEARNTVKFSICTDKKVYFIPFNRFKLLMVDNSEFNKVMTTGIESISTKTKPDRFNMSLFRFMISITKYIDNNNDGYIIPHNEKLHLKNDFRKLMGKLDGYHKTKEYRDIINRGNIKYVF
jgi:hypothetical protein